MFITQQQQQQILVKCFMAAAAPLVRVRNAPLALQLPILDIFVFLLCVYMYSSIYAFMSAKYNNALLLASSVCFFSVFRFINSVTFSPTENTNASKCSDNDYDCLPQTFVGHDSRTN